MKKTKLIVFWIVVCIVIIGCGKKTGIEGKVMDENEQPIAEVKIVAEQQDQKFKGYDHFETVTDSQGTFRFARLFPNSEYWITASKEGYFEGTNGVIHVGPEGTTSLLKDPIILRKFKFKEFKLSKDGIIIDSETGLMWTSDPGKDMTWDQATDYAHNLQLGGYDDWRLPNLAEFKELNKELYESGKINNIHTIFKLSHTWVWSSEVSVFSGDMYDSFIFESPFGGVLSFERTSSQFIGVLTVRSQK